MDVKERHPRNAPSPIVVTLFGIVMDVKEEQEENAPSSIVVTPSGIVMDVKEEHPENAISPIVVIPSPITTFSICSLFEDQGVVGTFLSLSHT